MLYIYHTKRWHCGSANHNNNVISILQCQLLHYILQLCSYVKIILKIFLLFRKDSDLQLIQPIPYTGNIWRQKIGKLGKSWTIRQSIPYQYSQIHWKCLSHNYALTVAYLPNFSSPIAFTCAVHQIFPPPNISCVQYIHS